MGRQAIVFSKSLAEMAARLNSSLTAAEKLDCLVQLTSRALGVRGCSLLLLDAKRKKLIHAATYGLSDRYVRAGVVDADKSLPEIMEGKTAIVTDTTSDPRIQFAEMARREHIASIIGVPVTCRGKIVGSLRAYNRIRREFTPAEEEFLITVANLMATVLESSGSSRPKEGSVSSGTKTALSSSPVRSPVRAVSFAHPSEEDFARLLDFYQIEWVYEPRSFMLEWEGDRVTEMFTPDFYLPGLDLYIEMTTLKPGLTSEKNRKVRRLRELYPDTKIKLLARRDYDHLLAKYGHGPLAGAKTEGVGRILFSADQIQMRVRQLAKEISQDYEGRRILLVGVLRGMLCFMADLMRYLEVPADVDFMAISYYGVGDGEAVHITKDLDVKPNGRHVVLVEDIVDTGMTLSFVLAHLEARHPASLSVCTLLDKKVRRLTDVPLAYVGFEVPDEFLVGYGLDYREEYRNLPFIALIRQQAREGGIAG